MTININIDTDTLVKCTELRDAETGNYINDATVLMTLYKRLGRPKLAILTPNAVTTAGTWTLTYSGETTGAIPYDADLWRIQSELEALNNVTTGDVTVSGQPLDEGINGLKFTWAETFVDAPSFDFDFSNLTGPTNANSTLVIKTRNLFRGDVVNKGGVPNKVGIPVIAHEVSAGDHIRIEGTKNYDGTYTVDATTSEDEIVVESAYTAETMSGRESLLVGIENGIDITLTSDGEDTGGYSGILPDTLKGIIEYAEVETSRGTNTIGTYELYIIITKDTTKRTDRIDAHAVYLDGD